MAFTAVEAVGHDVLGVHLGDFACVHVFLLGRRDSGDAVLERGDGVDGAGEGELDGPADAAGLAVLLAGGHDGAEHADVEEGLAHPLLGTVLSWVWPVVGGDAA